VNKRGNREERRKKNKVYALEIVIAVHHQHRKRRW
jgi:hypothetical protein